MWRNSTVFGSVFLPQTKSVHTEEFQIILTKKKKCNQIIGRMAKWNILMRRKQKKNVSQFKRKVIFSHRTQFWTKKGKQTKWNARGNSDFFFVKLLNRVKSLLVCFYFIRWKWCKLMRNRKLPWRTNQKSTNCDGINWNWRIAICASAWAVKQSCVSAEIHFRMQAKLSSTHFQVVVRSKRCVAVYWVCSWRQFSLKSFSLIFISTFGRFCLSIKVHFFVWNFRF